MSSQRIVHPYKTFNAECLNIFEVIPDSEEEIEQQQDATITEKAQAPGRSVQFLEVIEISDSSDDQNEEEVIPRTSRSNRNQTPGRARLNYSRSHIIESSDEESEDEVIELTDSSSEDIFSTPSKTIIGNIKSSPPSPSGQKSDDGIMVFDEPRSARKPLRVNAKSNNTPNNTSSDVNASSTTNFDVHTRTPLTPHKPVTLPKNKKLMAIPTSPRTPRASSKKAQMAAEQKRLHDYAQQLFADLNKTVFKQGLPENTELNWNKRLLTTAGRAKFHRSREGVQTTEIELAEKILDCDERIRNTLSHEMCHLATWVIDKKVDEHHGKLFKSWARKVMQKRPDINVSVKHNYEISYPYEWRCEKCAKIYGRFSKSIKPSECVCGSCKEGVLSPLFKVRSVTNRKISRMASGKSQDLPPTIVHPSVEVNGVGSVTDDSEVKVLANILGLTSLN